MKRALIAFIGVWIGLLLVKWLGYIVAGIIVLIIVYITLVEME